MPVKPIGFSLENGLLGGLCSRVPFDMGTAGKDKKQQKPAIYRRGLTGMGGRYNGRPASKDKSASLVPVPWSPGPGGRRGIIAAVKKPAVSGHSSGA